MYGDWPILVLLFIRSLHLTYQVQYALTTLGYAVSPAVKMELLDVPNRATLKYNEYQWLSRELHKRVNAQWFHEKQHHLIELNELKKMLFNSFHLSVQHNKQYHINVLLNSFRLERQALGFQKL